jgi:hypothetical protein
VFSYKSHGKCDIFKKVTENSVKIFWCLTSHRNTIQNLVVVVTTTTVIAVVVDDDNDNSCVNKQGTKMLTLSIYGGFNNSEAQLLRSPHKHLKRLAQEK